MTKKVKKNWLNIPNISPLNTLILSVTWAGVLVFCFQSSFGEYISNKVEEKLEFEIREHLNQSPPVSDRLKIYGVDDVTFSALGSWVLTTTQWADLLESLAKAKPELIVIDAAFSEIVEDANSADAIARIEQIKVPIAIGAFALKSKVMGRTPLHSDVYGIKYQGEISELDRFPDFRTPQRHVYGRHPKLAKAFKKTGHFLYNGTGKLAPFYRLGDDILLPHITLVGQPEIDLSAETLKVNGSIIPLDQNMLMPVNFTGTKKFLSRGNSVLTALNRAHENKPQKINEGDVVLVLPHLYTGNTDFKVTPLGEMPAGLILGATLNSYLLNNYLQPFRDTELAILAAALVGGTIAATLPTLTFWILFILLNALIITGSITLFCWKGIMIPWLFCSTSLTFSALSVFAEKMRAGERKIEFLRSALIGSLPDDQLRAVLKTPQAVNLEPRERVLTVMFVDIVGFSLVAERMQPRAAFDKLKEILSNLALAIHQHGGIVDKTLGDGILAYFGYTFENDIATTKHAENALRAAIQIQVDNVSRISNSSRHDDTPLFPLRIGINTTSCYIGDLGNNGKLEFTVVGNGVNFAKRLETACEINKILIGHSTFTLIQDAGFDPSCLSERWIPIKHHPIPVAAHDFNPFVDFPDRLAGADLAYQRSLKANRTGQRWFVPANMAIDLTLVEGGQGKLVNFSHSGLCCDFDRKVKDGEILTVQFQAVAAISSAPRGSDTVTVVSTEVCWSYESTPGSFTTGLRFVNLGDDQKSQLIQDLVNSVLEFIPKSEINAA